MNSRIARATKRNPVRIEHESMQFIMIMVIIIIDSVTGVCIYDITLSIVILGVLVEQHAGLNQHTASVLCL